MKKFWGSVAMITATVLWGIAFSAQSRGMDFVEPMLFTALRSATGVTALIAVIMIFDLCREKRLTFWGAAKTPEARKELLAGGWWCGVIITFASIAQQAGLKYTTAGKTGFLTALYIVIVPVMGVFLRRKPTAVMWLAVVLAMGGTYLLCGGITSINRGEWFVILCAFIYSLHILVIDRYAGKCDCVRLSCIQFAVAFVLALLMSLLCREPWEHAAVKSAMPFWLFCGIGSSAIAFTLQMVSQKYLHPVTATLLMSLESVFAVLGGWIFLKEHLNGIELCGCAVIFLAVLISQLPLPEKKRISEG